MSDLLTRIRTLLTALPTWLTVTAAVLSIVVQELADYVDNPTAAWIVRIGLGALTVVTVAIAIVRRVTEVIPGHRGLLPIRNPVPAASTGLRRRDAGLGLIETICLIVVVVFALYGLYALFG